MTAGAAASSPGSGEPGGWETGAWEPGPSASSGSGSAGSTSAAGETPPVATAGSSAGPTCPNCGQVAVPDALFCEECGFDFTTWTSPRTSGEPSGHAAGEAAGPAAHEAPTTVAPAIGWPQGSPEAGKTGGAGGAESSLLAETRVVGSPVVSQSQPPSAETVIVHPATPRQAGPAGAAKSVEWVAEVWVDPAWYQGQQTTHQLPSGGPPLVVPLRSRSALIGRRSSTKGIHPDIDCSADPGVSRRHAQLTTDGVRWFVEDLDSSNGSFVAPSHGPLPDQPIERSTKVELRVDDRLYVGAWTRIVVRPATLGERTF